MCLTLLIDNLKSRNDLYVHSQAGLKFYACMQKSIRLEGVWLYELIYSLKGNLNLVIKGDDGVFEKRTLNLILNISS